MLIIDTLGYRRFKLTPDPIEADQNPDLKPIIFEAEPYILAKGDEIKLEFHLFQYLNKPITTPPVTGNTGGMGSQDNIGTPGVSGRAGMPIPNPLSMTSLHLPSGRSGNSTGNEESKVTCCFENEKASELHQHHKTILEYNLNYLDIQLNGFKDWLSVDDCVARLYDELKPVTPDNFLISDILKRLSGFIKQDSIETRLFTPKILISSEYENYFEFLYNKAQGISYKFQNQITVYIDIEATLTVLVNNPEYKPADIIKIGNLPYRASTILNQTFATKPFVGYSPVQHTIHGILESSNDFIQIVKTTDLAPGIREARWGIDVASDKIKFIMCINYLID